MVVSKKRNARSKTTTNSNLICEADDVVEMMDGPSDFLSLVLTIN